MIEKDSLPGENDAKVKKTELKENRVLSKNDELGEKRVDEEC